MDMKVLKMANCKYKYADLKKTYKNFDVPCINISINGKKIKTLLATENKKNQSWKIDFLKVSLSMEKSSMVQIQISDIYDYGSSSITEIAVIGSSIEVMLGYGSESKSVFYGYIAKIDYEFKNQFYMVVTAFDALNLMEQEYCPEYYISKSHSDIINNIIKKYSSVIKKKSIDNISINKEFIGREEKISDLQFIKRLCSECGKMFYMFAGEVFITDKFDAAPVVNLDIHEALTSFKFSKMYQNCKIKVIGMDTENYDTDVTGESDIKISGYEAVTTSPQTKVITVPEISKATDAENYAKNICNDIAKSINAGTIYCIGLPEIKTGGCVTVSGVDKSTFDTYKFNVTEVVHTINYEGFNTVLTVNGWS